MKAHVIPFLRLESQHHMDGLELALPRPALRQAHW
jgi:hypothetical protein